MEARQKFENEKRHLVTENKNLQNSIQQLETDINDLKLALTEEQDARTLQVFKPFGGNLRLGNFSV